MLVLSRRPTQQIVISDNVTITIIDISGEQVKVGIQAPKDVPIRRRELLERSEQDHTRKERSNHGYSGRDENEQHAA